MPPAQGWHTNLWSVPYLKKQNKIKICVVFNNCCNYRYWRPQIPLVFLSPLLSLERGQGREKERERKTWVWVLVASRMPPLGTWPATPACALTGNWTCNPSFRGQYSIHWATPARALWWFFETLFFFPSLHSPDCSRLMLTQFLWGVLDANTAHCLLPGEDYLSPCTVVLR